MWDGIICNDVSHWLGANLESALLYATSGPSDVIFRPTLHHNLWWHTCREQRVDCRRDAPCCHGAQNGNDHFRSVWCDGYVHVTRTKVSFTQTVSETTDKGEEFVIRIVFVGSNINLTGRKEMTRFRLSIVKFVHTHRPICMIFVAGKWYWNNMHVDVLTRCEPWDIGTIAHVTELCEI